MDRERTHYEYYQLRAMLEWELADRATTTAKRDAHRVEAEKCRLMAKNAKRGWPRQV